MSSFDFAVLKQAAEARDADTLVDLYAEDAEVRVVNKTTPPGSPRILKGKDAIAEWLRDVASRDMTHVVSQEVVGDRRLAYTEACEYSTGEKVLSAALAELSEQGQIISQLMVETWDE